MKKMHNKYINTKYDTSTKKQNRQKTPLLQRDCAMRLVGRSTGNFAQIYKTPHLKNLVINK